MRFAYLLASLILALALPARAQQESVAETLFRAGRDAFKSGSYAEACAKFAESQRLDPSPGTLLNLAVCEERRGRVATAWAKFRELLDTLDPTDPRTRVAQEHLAALEPSLPQLRLRLEPAPATDVVVKLDDAALSVVSQNLFVPIDPGEHRLEVADGAGTIHREIITIGLGERLERVLPSKRSEHAPASTEATNAGARRAAPRPTPVAPTRDMNQDSMLPVIGLAIAGAGVAALGVGAYFALDAKALKDDSNANGHCVDNQCDSTGFRLRESAVDKADLATVFLLTGAALGAGGVTLYFANRQAGARKPAANLTLSASGLVFTARILSN